MTEPLDCDEVIEKLFEFLDRELDPALEREIERHIADCRGCFSRAEFERRLKERIAEAASAEAPRRLHRRARQMIERFDGEEEPPGP